MPQNRPELQNRSAVMARSSRLVAAFLSALLLGGAQPQTGLPENHPVSVWLAKLVNGGSALTFDDAYSLTDAGPDKEQSARALIALLKDEREEVAGYAASALGQLGLAPDLAVPALIEAFENPDDFVSQHALMAAIAFGKPAIPHLVKALDWESYFDTRPISSRTRATYAAIALFEIGPDAVNRLLTTPRDVELNPYAISVVNHQARYTIQRLEEKLRGTDEKIRISVINILGQMKTNALEAAPAVAARLTSRSVDERAAAAEALTAVGPIEGELRVRLVPLLIRALDDSSSRVQAGVLKTLGHCGTLDAQAIRRVARLYSSSKAEVRDAVVSSLGSTGKGSKVASATLAKALNDPDQLVRSDAVKTLPLVDPSNVPPLIRALRDKDAAMRQAAAKALRAIRGSEATAVSALATAAQSDSYASVRIAAVESLGALGPKAASAVPALIGLLKDSRIKTSYTIQALSKIGPAAASASDALVAQASSVPTDSGMVIVALGNMGPSGTQAIQQIWDHSSRAQRGEILKAIQERREAASALVPWLISLYTSRSDQSAAAIAALGKMGPSAVDFLVMSVREPLGPGCTAWSALIEILNNYPDLASTVLMPLAVPFQALSDDPSAYCREVASRILPSLGVPALAVLRKALLDTDAGVRIIAAESLRFDAYERGARLDDATLQALTNVLHQPYSEIHGQVLLSLGSAGSRAAFAAPAIIPFLNDSDEDIAAAAATALLRIGTIPPEIAQTAHRQMLDAFIADHVETMKSEVEDDAGPINPRRRKRAPEQAGAANIDEESVQELPKLPSPMPQPSAWAVLDQNLLGNDATKLKDLELKLARGLTETGFSEPGLFSFRSGFGLVAQVERIHQDGTPYAPPDRWSTGKLPLRSFHLGDYLSSLFFDTPGEFRLFVFLVTAESNPITSKENLSEDAAHQLAVTGGRLLPDSIGNLTLKGRNCFVLVYQFERDQGQFATLAQSAISAREHLQKVGLVRALQ